MTDTAFDPETLLGTRLGTYELQMLIGTGGMGYVYLANDVSLDREVAVKVLRPEFVRDKEFAGRFTREARVIAKLEHPNIVQIHTAGKVQDHLFLAMQLCRGETVEDLVQKQGALPVEEALGITRQVAEALDYAHRRDLMHRDIKPTNIMVAQDGDVKIMDFGLARSIETLDGLTKTGVFFGTPEYSSPEQCQMTKVDSRTDIFSLGVVLFEMLVGGMPWEADTPISLFKKIAEEPPRKLGRDIPEEVRALVDDMLAKDREKRVQTAREVIERIDRITGGPEPQPKPRPRALPWLAGALAGMVAVILAVILYPAAEDPVPLIAPVQRTTTLLFTDFVMGSADDADPSYRVAIPDMMSAQLGQLEHLRTIPRTRMLWKIRETEPGADSISDDDRPLLLKSFTPDFYVTGIYHLRRGRIRVHVECFRVGASPELAFRRRYEAEEGRFFELIDEMTAGFTEALGEEGPDVAARETFRSQFELARLEGGAAERTKKGDGFRINRVLKTEQQMRQWVYGVQMAVDRVRDRDLAASLRQELTHASADVGGLESLNRALKENSEETRVRIVCARHDEVATPGAACWNCGSDLKVIFGK